MAFSLTARIGRGRTTDTFAARLSIGGEELDVAVKRLRPEFAQNEAFVAAFLKWAEEQKAFEHENLVGVLEAGRTEEGAYVIEERVDGASLAQVLASLARKKRTMSMKLALHVAMEVAGALALLHGCGAPHGELDPGEVLISYSGEVKVVDQRLHLLDVHLGVEPSEDAAAAPLYRPPELQRGMAPPVAASDVYALALIVLEMLIGKPVWSAPSMTVQAAIAALRDFAHVGLANPLLTEDLARLLASCVRELPSDRLAGGEELRAAFASLIEKHALAADRGALAAFVGALVPPAKDDDNAPTAIADAAALAAMERRQTARQAEVESASVPVDPELDRKALSRVAASPSSAPARWAGRFAGWGATLAQLRAALAQLRAALAKWSRLQRR